MRLYIMRHAWAVPPDPFHLEQDELRPLSEEGRRRLHRWAEQLQQQGIAPQVVLTSPLARAVQTAQILADILPGQPAVRICPELAPGVELPRLLQAVANMGAESMLWVGHMPDVAELAQALVCPGTAACQHFAPAAMAVLEFDGPPTPGGGRLLQVLDPAQCGV